MFLLHIALLKKDEIVNLKMNLGVKAEAYIPTPYTPAYTSASYSRLTKTKVDGEKDNGDRYALNLVL